MKLWKQAKHTISSSQEISKELKRYKFIVIALIVALILVAVTAIEIASTRFVLVNPYGGGKGYKLYMHHVDPHFLLGMTLQDASTYFDLTPANVDVTNELFLSRLSPRAYSAMKQQLIVRAKNMIRQGQSQYFIPTLGGEVNTKTNTVTIKGQLHEIIAKEEVAVQSVTVTARYDVDFGQVQLSGWSVQHD